MDQHALLPFTECARLYEKAKVLADDKHKWDEAAALFEQAMLSCPPSQIKFRSGCAWRLNSALTANGGLPDNNPLLNECTPPRLEQAIRAFRDATELLALDFTNQDPAKDEAYLYWQKSWQQALTFFPWWCSGTTDWGAARRRAEALAEENELGKAVQAYSLSLDLLPDYEEFDEVRGGILCDRAIYLVRLGMEDRAFDDAVVAVAINPKRPSAWLWRGVARFRLEGRDLADGRCYLSIAAAKELEEERASFGQSCSNLDGIQIYLEQCAQVGLAWESANELALKGDFAGAVDEMSVALQLACDWPEGAPPVAQSGFKAIVAERKRLMALRPKTCSTCGAESEKMSRCSRCKLVNFCSKKCLREAWPSHKRACGNEAAAQLRARRYYEKLKTRKGQVEEATVGLVHQIRAPPDGGSFGGFDPKLDPSASLASLAFDPFGRWADQVQRVWECIDALRSRWIRSVERTSDWPKPTQRRAQIAGAVATENAAFDSVRRAHDALVGSEAMAIDAIIDFTDQAREYEKRCQEPLWRDIRCLFVRCPNDEPQFAVATLVFQLGRRTSLLLLACMRALGSLALVIKRGTESIVPFHDRLLS